MGAAMHLAPGGLYVAATGARARRRPDGSEDLATRGRDCCATSVTAPDQDLTYGVGAVSAATG